MCDESHDRKKTVTKESVLKMHETTLLERRGAGEQKLLTNNRK